MSFTVPIAAPAEFTSVPFTTNASDLADAAIAALQADWPAWVPNDGNFEVALIEVLAAIVSTATETASQMSAQAVAVLMQRVFGFVQNPGQAASATATFTMIDTAGYVIPAGSQLLLGNVPFQVQSDITITSGDQTGSGLVVATSLGTFANGLTATGWSTLSLPAGVTGVTLAAPTDGGQDPESSTDFLTTCAQDLQLRGRSLITLPQLEIRALQVLTADIGGGRVNATASGAAPRNITLTCTDVNGDPLSTDESANVLAAVTAPNTRMVNAQITVADANYCTVGATYTAQALPNVDATGLGNSMNAAFSFYLSPATWGQPTSGTNNPGQSWINQPTVHVNKLIALAGTVSGLDYIETLNLFSTGAETLSAALSTSAAITSLPVHAITTGNIGSGAGVIITDPTGAHTQTFTTSAAVAPGATSIPIVSATPNFAYPTTSTLLVHVTGDLTMPGVAPLPQPGNFIGTIVTPSPS